MSDINDVADSIADINALEDVIADIQTLADIEDGTVAEDAISDLAAIASDVTTCATDIADISTVADDLNEETSEIETVAGSIANVNNVGDDIDNVNTVAANLTSINNFADRYTVRSGQPDDPNDGDLWWDQDSDLLKAYDEDGDQWVAVTTESDTGLDTTGGTMTGVLVLDDARNAGAPVLAFTSDSNTGIFSSGADSVDISANGATRLQVTGTAVKSNLPTEVEVTTDTTNAVTTALTIESQSSETPAAGIGVGMDFAVETAADNVEIGAQIEAVTTDVGSGAEDIDLVVNLMEGGAAAAEKFRIASDGDVTAQGSISTEGNLTLNTAGADLVLTGTNNAETPVERTITIQAPTGAADFNGNYTLTLPINDGDANDFLQSDGEGNLSWQEVDVSFAPLLSNELSTDGDVTIGGTTVASRRNAALVGPYTIKDNEEILINDGSKLVIL